MLSSTGTDGKSSGLRVKFNDWKSNRWMSGSQDYVRSPRSSRDVDSDSRISFKSALRGVELEREVSDFDVPLTKMASMESSTPVVRGDTGGGGGSHPCFVAGTQVLLSDGQTKNIEEMEKGDLVLSYNEETSENQVGEVLQTMVHRVDEDIYAIHIGEDTIESTGNHRFWIARCSEKMWIPASDLVVGDLVMFSDNSLHPISEINV